MRRPRVDGFGARAAELCDLYALGADRLLRMYNPKGASGRLRCVQLLRPQLLDASFLSAMPGFWSCLAQEQTQLVADFYGAARSLDVPHEVVDVRLHEGSGLVALVGVHRVSVVVLPPSGSLSAPADAAMDDLGAMLGQLGLGEYGAALRDEPRGAPRDDVAGEDVAGPRCSCTSTAACPPRRRRRPPTG